MKLKKFFLDEGMQMGVKYRSSRPPPRRPRGGSARPGRLAESICPQGFVHGYPQIPVDNLKATHNVLLNLWITATRLYIMDVV
jgi:hypothetical protein